MSNYPNYRNTVEIIIQNEGKVLLTKRSEDSVVAPGVWNVPAGKVKYEEIPVEALYREAKEETNLEVELVKELSVRNFTGETATGEKYYRVVFTYLVKPKNDDVSALHIDEEHSDYAWVDKEELQSEKYDSLLEELKTIISEQVF
ncbi:NUDIX domain-containing protein [Fervidibacillus albus]|uniref:NUDIX domain-containing protein n=1 Tax=Fervidibacillus albus TaxID=2980026 RepID=A0A9E8LW39_9BACI|nr:NUDIX domain-containing protein [Fervidibacillus albus]WAA09864.1 NUDIX domain-containing protein [Fervidibacillus albus]